MYEPCEESGKCNVDQRSFKAYLSRWLAATSKLAPFTHDTTLSMLSTSAKAAIKTCTGGTSGTRCGLKWTTGAHDGSVGVGEQMAVLEAVQSNLVDTTSGWLSAVKGTGTSQGDVNAGSSSGSSTGLTTQPATSADKAGAGILTALILVGVVGGSITMLME
jgi:mannan endo-1,6-alpha-mannosidase